MKSHVVDEIEPGVYSVTLSEGATYVVEANSRIDALRIAQFADRQQRRDARPEDGKSARMDRLG